MEGEKERAAKEKKKSENEETEDQSYVAQQGIVLNIIKKCIHNEFYHLCIPSSSLENN